MSSRGGRELRDRYRRDYPQRSEERSHHGRSNAPPSRHLWVGNLSHSISENTLTHHFLQFGELDSVAFQPGRSYAFINFKNEDEAFAAVKALQGFFVAGNPLKIEFAKAEKATSSARDEGYSQRSRDDQRSRLSPYSQRESRSRHPSPDSSSKMGDKNAEPSEVLWIGFPALLKVDEVILRRAFSPFGEIEKITAFPGRSYAFVRFKNVMAACRAKETLQGKLFGNPRVHICFARSEMATSSNSGRSSSQNPAPPSPNYRSSYGRPGSPDRYFGNNMQSHHDGLRSPRFAPKLENEGLWFEQGGRFQEVGPDLGSMYENRRSPPTRERGIRYREFSPPPPPLQFPPQFNDDAWDLPEEALLFHGTKKLKTNNSFPSENELPEYPFSEAEQVKRVLPRVSSDFPQHENFESGTFGYWQMPPDHGMNLGPPPPRGDRSDHWNVPPAYDNFQAATSVNPVDWKRLTPEESHHSSPNKEWKWEGTIAKGGTPVCRARCFPVGKVLDMILPEFLDCTARTGLDMLAKHYYQAAGAWVVFFVPQSDADIGFYNEFMNYLGEKQRAAVAKLDDKATLFLVPPSEFSEKVLKVPGKLSISGVILRLENPGPGLGSLPHPPEKKDPNFMPFDTSYSMPLSPSGAYSSMPPPPFSNFAKPGPNNLPFAPSVNHHEQMVHQRNGPLAAPNWSSPHHMQNPNPPNWSSPHHMQNANLGSRNMVASQVPNSVSDTILQGYNNSAIPSSSNYKPPPPPVSSSTAGAAALQPEQLAQLASSLLGQQRHMGEDFRPTNAINQPDSSYRAPQRYDNQAGPEFLGSSSQYGQVQQMQQHQQQLLMQQAANPPVAPPSQGGTQEEADSDPQKRLQATLQLAAALLHQIQQGKGT